MTNRERFEAILNGQRADRTPVIEWATYWDKTVHRWLGEGLSLADEPYPVNRAFGQDKLWQMWFRPRSADCPTAPYHGAPVLETAEEYALFREKYLMTDAVLEQARAMLEDYLTHDPQGEYALWFTLEGFFWFPRTLLGIQNHLYAFYDQPELILAMNRDLCDFHKKVLALLYERVTPQFMTFAEDMSYNNGPMISRAMYRKFMAPFYDELIPFIRSHGTKVFIDTDGDVEPLIPWFMESGIQGVLPLERQAGVDVNRVREKYPDFLMIGGFDKTVMKKGEAAMRAEFERIRPAIQAGGYIPSADHQTPPDVSLEQYRVFMGLLREYTKYE